MHRPGPKGVERLFRERLKQIIVVNMVIRVCIGITLVKRGGV